MKKLAIFVEGETEQYFVEQLIRAIADQKTLALEVQKLQGGSSLANPRAPTVVSATGIKPESKFYVLILNSSTDNRVVSDVKDNIAGMHKQGYSAIIGIRDVFPQIARADIPKLRAGMQASVTPSPLPITFILGVMEGETWFISEATHFERIHTSLTPDHIAKNLGWDPRTDDLQLRANPADDLDRAYSLAGRRYKKEKDKLLRTVKALSMDEVYLRLGARIPDLKRLNESIDQFLTE